jgi:hypothetical protein
MSGHLGRKCGLVIVALVVAIGLVSCSSVLAKSPDAQPISHPIPDDVQIQALINARGNQGGVVQLPCRTLYIRHTITIRNPIELRGCGTSIGAPPGEAYKGIPIPPEFPGTRVVWMGGEGIAIDVGPQSHDINARGTVLRDFNLENHTEGTIGIRINTQEPRVINVYVVNLGDLPSGKPFSIAGITVGDLGIVNDFLCRDCYVRFQQDGIQLLTVSEATIDHSRILENFGNNIVLGDPHNIANNIQIVNGTNFSNVNCETCTQAGTGAGIKISRAANIVNIVNGYCESNPGTYCIDATNVIGGNLNQLNIRDTYFATGQGGTLPAAYAIGLNAPSANVLVSGNVFLGQSTAGVLNEKSETLFTPYNLLLNGTPAIVSPTITKMR